MPSFVFDTENDFQVLSDDGEGFEINYNICFSQFSSIFNSFDAAIYKYKKSNKESFVSRRSDTSTMY